jgi:hypothetical protein
MTSNNFTFNFDLDVNFRFDLSFAWNFNFYFDFNMNLTSTVTLICEFLFDFKFFSDFIFDCNLVNFHNNFNCDFKLWLELKFYVCRLLCDTWRNKRYILILYFSKWPLVVNDHCVYESVNWKRDKSFSFKTRDKNIEIMSLTDLCIFEFPYDFVSTFWNRESH